MFQLLIFVRERWWTDRFSQTRYWSLGSPFSWFERRYSYVPMHGHGLSVEFKYLQKWKAVPQKVTDTNSAPCFWRICRQEIIWRWETPAVKQSKGPPCRAALKESCMGFRHISKVYGEYGHMTKKQLFLWTNKAILWISNINKEQYCTHPQTEDFLCFIGELLSILYTCFDCLQLCLQLASKCSYPVSTIIFKSSLPLCPRCIIFSNFQKCVKTWKCNLTLIPEDRS